MPQRPQAQGNAKERMQFTVENARLLFRNFSGKKDIFGTEDVRSFSVTITDPNTKKFEMFENHGGQEVRSMEITYTRAK